MANLLPARRAIAVCLGSALVAVSGCAALDSRGSSSESPNDWAYAVIESPIGDKLGLSNAKGRLVLLDDDGQEVWSFETSGLEGAALAHSDDALFFADTKNDYVLLPGQAPVATPRQATGKGATLQHAQLWDEESSTGLALFNEGTFASSLIDPNGDNHSAVFDEYINSAWNCGDGWKVMFTDDATDDGEVLTGAIDERAALVDVVTAAEVNGTPAYPAPDISTPCVDGKGVVMLASYAPSEDDIETLSSLHLAHSDGVETELVDLSGWESIAADPSALPVAAGVHGENYLWVSADGVFRSAPLAGGDITVTHELSLPDPLPASSAFRFEGGELTIMLGDDEGVSVSQWSADAPSELTSHALHVTPKSEQTYFSDIVVRD